MMSRGSPDQMTRSASLPGTRDPSRSSTRRTRAGLIVTARSAASRSMPSLTASAAWTISRWTGTIGWSVAIDTVTPAAASRPGLASVRFRSSTLDREVISGPATTGTPAAAILPAIR